LDLAAGAREPDPVGLDGRGREQVGDLDAVAGVDPPHPHLPVQPHLAFGLQLADLGGAAHDDAARLGGHDPRGEVALDREVAAAQAQLVGHPGAAADPHPAALGEHAIGAEAAVDPHLVGVDGRGVELAVDLEQAGVDRAGAQRAFG
ncbi:MAG: hypothetical protein ACK559_14115, partial [bacterium]